MNPEPNPAPEAAKMRQLPFRRLLPLVVVAVLLVIVYAMGWHRELSLETLIRHRTAIDGFIVAHKPVAILAFIGFYITVAALSIPAGAWLTITGGFLFGTVVGALATIVGATVGATILFLIAQSAAGEYLRAVPGRAASCRRLSRGCI
jgi:uncharacterized membrane protein YdjX (TVP38/TMEM64 family)